MAVAVDATGTKKYQAASTSFSDATVITVGSGNALVVTVAFGYAVTPPTTVTATWNGVAMTTLANIDSSNGSVSTYVFGLRSPASGANTLALAWTNSCEVFIDAISFSGVDVTSDIYAFPNAGRVTGNVIAQTVDVPSSVGHYVVASVAPSNVLAVPTGTTLFDDSSSGSFINAAACYDVGAPTVNIGVTLNGSNFVLIATADVAPSGTTSGVRLRQRWYRPSLAYPVGVAPGFDPSHPAAWGLNGFVFPGNGNNAINLAGSAGFARTSVSTGLTSKIDQFLGQSTQTVGVGDYAEFITLALPTTTTGTGYTFASFVKPLDVANTTIFISFDDPNNTGVGLYQGVIGGNFGIRLSGTVTFDSGIAAANGIPYFYACSLIYRGASVWDHNHVILRLDTGQLTKVSVTGTSQGAITFTSAYFHYAGNPGFGAAVNLGPAMTSTTALGLPQLIAWANDPWAFWYPRQTQRLISITSTAATIQYTAFSTSQHSLSQVVRRMVGY